jgi:hypothetical protein
MSTRRFCVSVTTFKFFRVFVVLFLTQVWMLLTKCFTYSGVMLSSSPYALVERFASGMPRPTRKRFVISTRRSDKTLIVFLCSAAICMALQLEMRIGFASEIFLEVAR